MVSPSATAIPGRSALVLGLLLVLGSALLPLLIFGLTPYATVQALASIPYPSDNGYRATLALTPTRYAWLRGGLLVAALAAGAALTAISRRAHARSEWGCLRREAGQVVRALRHTWRALHPAERRLAGGLLGALLLVRTGLLVAQPLSTDETAAYDYFIHEGPVAIGSFYPFPNNHPLFNFACWLLSRLPLPLPVVLRLPTLLAATVGTAVAYALLTRQVGFVAATVGTGLFSFSPLGLTYAAAGRGYFLQLTLVLAAFFAALALLQRTQRPRLAWAVFAVASVAGLYTIPTFIYPLAALGLGLALGFARARQWADLVRLALLGAAVAVAAALLYAPMVAVTGLPALTANRYVASLDAATFWAWFPGYLRLLAGTLAGNGALGIAGAAALALLGPVLGREPARRPLLGLLGLLLLVPVGLMAVQRVLAPARTLLFMGCFGSIFVGVAVAAGLARLRVPVRGQVLGILLLVGSYAGYQVTRVAGAVPAERRQARLFYASYRWLIAHGAQRVWQASPRHELFWRHFALIEHRPSLLPPTQGDHQPYEFVAVQSDGAGLPASVRPPRYAPVYRDALVVIYRRVRK